VAAGDSVRPAHIHLFITQLDQSFRLLNLKNDNLRRKFDALKYDVQKVEQVVYDLTIRQLKPTSAQLNCACKFTLTTFNTFLTFQFLFEHIPGGSSRIMARTYKLTALYVTEPSTIKKHDVANTSVQEEEDVLASAEENTADDSLNVSYVSINNSCKLQQFGLHFNDFYL
jgi:hypothetical protein